jgi:hypothetical protein
MMNFNFSKTREKKPFSNIVVALKPIGNVIHEWAQLEKSCNDLLENIKN